MKKRVARKVIKAGMETPRIRYSTFLQATIIEPDYYSYVGLLYHQCRVPLNKIKSRAYPKETRG